MSPSSPTSPRHISIQIDPHLPLPSHSRAMTSPSSLSPSRAIGPGSLGVQPTLHRGGSGAGRGWDEAEARSRQMQQDIDSAMSMSRARSNSIINDPSPALRPSLQHYHSTSPIEENPFPMLSDMEEAEMDRARSSGFHGRDMDEHSDSGQHPSFHINVDEQDEDEFHHRSGSRSHSHRGGESMSSGAYEHGHAHSRLIRRHSDDGDHRRERARHLGHDRHERDLDRMTGLVGGTVGAGNRFDFGAMEDFAATEREKLGLSDGIKIPAVPVPVAALRQRNGPAVANGSHAGTGMEEHQDGVGSYDTTMARTETFSAYGTEADHLASPPKEEGGTSFARRRQRKLSSSNPVTRRGGKLALFEGFGSQGGAGATGLGAGMGVGDGEDIGTPFKAARQPKNALPIGPGPHGGGMMPYSDTVPGHDRPYRFSFYSNALPVTIHARTLAELPAEGQTFEDLFKGKSSASAEGGSGSGGMAGGMDPVDRMSIAADDRRANGYDTPRGPGGGGDVPGTGKSGLLARAADGSAGKSTSGDAVSITTGGLGAGARGGQGMVSVKEDDPESYTWWLDVLSPTDEEMRMLSKVFGIHPLTTEDILLEETREKIELFRNYYLVCFRSFDQDPYSQTYLEPLNMYIIVFREGTLSFHFRGTPHPQNVRRRIKHLKDYISVTSDWISYALIDDITDAFGPLIQSIEYEVDSIDELVLILKDSEQSDMLRRIGTCRKKVMGLLRLMGNKADVVKGLAKRCNEQWLVAPKSDIGLYLSDIQDHLITMTQNLNHYEKILSRSHSNYLAQISIEMTDANNQINDVLSKLTALGTVLIPMNLVTGLWGMNVHVPGQDAGDDDNLAWFGGILGCLIAFAICGAWATYKCFVTR